MPLRFVAALIAALSLPMFATGAAAQECIEYSDDGALILKTGNGSGLVPVIVQYGTVIGPQDLINSSGVRLSNFMAVLQQDRANVNRFGRPDVTDVGGIEAVSWFTDERDGFFTTVERRALFSSMTFVDQCWADAGDTKWFTNRVLNGNTGFLFISIFNHPNGGLGIHISEAG